MGSPPNKQPDFEEQWLVEACTSEIRASPDLSPCAQPAARPLAALSQVLPESFRVDPGPGE